MARITNLKAVPEWHAVTDVIVAGFGGAGACAALEARAAGSEVMVLERFSDGGGSTELSACEMYLGGNGGTTLQKDLGFTDSSDNFRDYLKAAFGDYVDGARLEAYVAGAAEHFDWMEAQGVPYKRGFFPGRDVVAMTGDSLQYSGNERAWPFKTKAEPVPRAHLPADADHNGGKVLMGVLKQQVRNSGADVRCDVRVNGLIQDDAGQVCGVVARIDNRDRYLFARQGVVLTMGGFIMNETMTRQHIPEQDALCTRHGNPGDMGDGIQMGVAAGGCAINMQQAFLCVAHYPPAELTYGIFVNEQGQRFVNEDVYLSRLGQYALQQTNHRIFMFIDNHRFARPAYQELADVIAVGETVAEVEAEAGMPAGVLQQTVAFYNEHAARGEDPLFHKAADWLEPFEQAPFALVDYSLERIRPAVFTLGGLDALPGGEVVTENGEPIPGLFAAGRTTAGIPRTSLGYASGMSVGDATFFGRQAGQSVAKCKRRAAPN